MGINVVVKMVRLSFPHLFEPSGFQGSEPKYSCKLIIPKSDKATMNELAGYAKQLIDEKWKGKKPANFREWYVDGDTILDEDGNVREEYANSWRISASSKIKPGIVDQSVNPVMDPELIYAGCYVNASLSMYAYDNISKGIGFGLSHVQFAGDGKRLGGSRISASQAFDKIDIAPEEATGEEPF